MDIYSTGALNRVIRALDRPQTPFLSTFFPYIQQSTDEKVYFDSTVSDRRLAPLVSPLKEGRLVEARGFTTTSLAPAYVKDKRRFDPNGQFKRLAGETIGGSLSPEQRLQQALLLATADQIEKLNRRKEVMAVEILLTGQLVLSGVDYPAVTVNFGRDAALTVTLAGGARWGEASVDPYANLEAWILLMLTKSGAYTADVIMDAKAWGLFRIADSVKPYLNTAVLNNTNQALKFEQFATQGMKFMGRLGELDFWVHADWYEADETNTLTPFLPDYTVLLVSDQLEGVQHHGAIRDIDANLQPLEYFQKSWTIPDPSARILLLQSAPLPAPYRVNASMRITVR